MPSEHEEKEEEEDEGSMKKAGKHTHRKEKEQKEKIIKAHAARRHHGSLVYRGSLGWHTQKVCHIL